MKRGAWWQWALFGVVFLMLQMSLVIGEALGERRR